MVALPLLLLLSGAVSAPDPDLATVTTNLPDPPGEYTSGPLWVWNDWLTPDMLEHALGTLADAHIRQVWVHPRPGLMTPYLSDAWFDLWRTTLETAQQRGLLVWIYDENSYPSGFAGGNVPEAMPESRALGLRLDTVSTVDPADPAVLAIYRPAAAGYVDVTQELKQTGPRAGERYVVARLEAAKHSPWYGGKYHVDLLRPGVTDLFLRTTMEAYRAQFGAAFGKRIPGVFTDEPHLRACGDMHWTPDLPAQYAARWGEDFFQDLPSLKDASDTGRRFRHHYFQVLNELFVDRWAKPYYAYCQQYGLELTGHYWEHDWPKCVAVPDNMAMSAWQQRPGIDILFNQYGEGVHAQFGNVRAVIELASVANQTGRARTLCETYGGSGAEMRFEDYKRIGDWVTVLGVNTLNEHLSDVSVRGARKRDYPPTFSYHSPWMSSYHVLVDYFARVSYALAQGKQINPCVILEPTTTAWMYNLEDSATLEALGERFQAMVVSLAQAQFEFDLGSEHILQERGSVSTLPDGTTVLVVGERAYAAVVLPEDMQNLNRATYTLLHQFLEQGGTVFSCAGPGLPSHLDGQADPACAALQSAGKWVLVEPQALAETVDAFCKPAVRVVLDATQRGIVYHHRRQLADGDLIFLANTSDMATATGTVIGAVRGIREARLDSGRVQTYPARQNTDGTLGASFSLPPCGSMMLFLDKQPVPAIAAPVQASSVTPVALSERSVTRLDDNNLILDYVSVSVGEERQGPTYWRQAADFTFKKSGLAGNLWDHAVQFRDELLRTPFADESGFEATYRFFIRDTVPTRLHAVVERPDLYAITCNGQPVSAIAGSWWLDRAFGRIDIAGAAKVGENVLTLRAAPMTVFHELEAAHLVGDFSVLPAEAGFEIAPAKTLELGPWNTQGLPLYGHRVAYAAVLDHPEPTGHYRVQLPLWQGVVATVIVNGQEAGCIYHAPMECDITTLLTPGKNQIEVVVCGSLRNTLGPHLGNAVHGLTAPNSWNQAPASPQPPGAAYDTIAYGLMVPFEVLHAMP